MSSRVDNRSGSIRPPFESTIYLPLFLVLTLAACLNAYQISALPVAGEAPETAGFLSILAARLVYFWYFLLLAACVHWNSLHVRLSRATALRWLGVHLATLTLSFIVHEAIVFGVATLLGLRAGSGVSEVYVRLFNNPAVWIEIFVYVLLLLFFSLLEYRRISRENELACAELEAGLAKTKLRELRTQIQPEFLFTTLATILALVREKRNGDANRILSLLGDFLRTTVYDTDVRNSSPARSGEPSEFARDADIDQLRNSQLQSVKLEIERIVHEDSNTHH
ncbi:MAG TPA: histidine kinase [Bacteroidota bacterium]|nr:histidine kinase [Bacteroidota bacterium]